MTKTPQREWVGGGVNNTVQLKNFCAKKLKFDDTFIIPEIIVCGTIAHIVDIRKLMSVHKRAVKFFVLLRQCSPDEGTFHMVRYP